MIGFEGSFIEIILSCGTAVAPPKNTNIVLIYILFSLDLVYERFYGGIY